MTLEDIQYVVKNFSKNKNINSNVTVRVIDLVSEVGELSKEVLKGTNYGFNEFCKTEDWHNEIGDVLFSLICIANETNTDLEKCLNHVLHKYENRFSNNGNIGSNK